MSPAAETKTPKPANAPKAKAATTDDAPAERPVVNITGTRLRAVRKDIEMMDRYRSKVMDGLGDMLYGKDDRTSPIIDQVRSIDADLREHSVDTRNVLDRIKGVEDTVANLL